MTAAGFAASTLARLFTGIVGEGNLIIGRSDLLPYLTDWRGRYIGGAPVALASEAARWKKVISDAKIVVQVH